MKRRKISKTSLMILVMLGWAATARPEIIITGLMHGTLPGGAPKAIELYISGSENLADFEIWRSTNGAAFGSGSGSIASLSGNYSNTFVYLVKSDQVGVFINIWGDSGIYANIIPMGILTGNGNDGFQVRRKVDSEVIDQVWEENATDSYRDSYWYRNHGTGPDGGWIISNWVTPGNDALDGLDEAGHRAAVPFGTYAIAWKGISYDWNSGANWSSSVVPGHQTNVFIADTVAHYPVIDNIPEDPAECLNLTLSGSSALTVDPGKALTVHGNLYLTGESLRSTTTGMILEAGMGLAPTGSLKVLGTALVNANIKKHFPKDNRWRMISPPVQDQSIRPVFAPVEPDQSFDLYSWDESSPVGQGWVNIRDENGLWNPLFEETFMTYKGYLISYSELNTGDDIRTFSGPINYGDHEIPVNHSDNHWNLSGNPYTCGLDWSSEGISKGDVAGGAMYVWDPGLNAGLGGYRAHNGTIGVPEGTTSVIPSMQGFFVQALQEGSISINVDAGDPLVHADLLYKQSVTRYAAGHIRLKAVRWEFSDEVLIAVHPDASVYYDPELDAVKLFAGHDEAPEIYSTALSGPKLCINLIDEVPGSVSVGVICQDADFIRLSAFDFETLEPWVGIHLEDKLEEKWVNLREEHYDFVHDPSQPGERFMLHLMNAADQEEILPGADWSCYFSEGRIHLNQAGARSGRLSVFSTDGRKISEWQVGPGSQVISCGLASGIYILRLSCPGNVTSRKMIVN